jgi:F-type H+-transporting ATPase subunit b
LEQQVAEAEKNRAEAAALLEEQRKLLAQARSEAHEILNKAKGVADKERAALLAKAREEYEQLLTRARKEIAEEREKALVALRREAVDLSIAAASKLIEANLDTDANRHLAMEYLASLEHQR